LQCEFLRPCRCQDGGEALLFHVSREGAGRKRLVRLALVPTTDGDDPDGPMILLEIGQMIETPQESPA